MAADAPAALLPPLERTCELNRLKQPNGRATAIASRWLQDNMRSLSTASCAKGQCHPDLSRLAQRHRRHPDAYSTVSVSLHGPRRRAHVLPDHCDPRARHADQGPRVREQRLPLLNLCRRRRRASARATYEIDIEWMLPELVDLPIAHGRRETV